MRLCFDRSSSFSEKNLSYRYRHRLPRFDRSGGSVEGLATDRRPCTHRKGQGFRESFRRKEVVPASATVVVEDAKETIFGYD